MAVAACLSLEMAPIGWVAEHRRHHQFSDEENDPHSPWRFGTTKRALTKGFVYSHMGWLFNKERTNPERFAPDLLKDPAMLWLDKHYGYIVASSFLLPTLIGGLWSWSWQGAVTAFFWAGLVRVSLLHHVTFSINSICHMVGDRPFDSGDKAANFWPLAILSFGESWHNSHHTDPTLAFSDGALHLWGQSTEAKAKLMHERDCLHRLVSMPVVLIIHAPSHTMARPRTTPPVR